MLSSVVKTSLYNKNNQQTNGKTPATEKQQTKLKINNSKIFFYVYLCLIDFLDVVEVEVPARFLFFKHVRFKISKFQNFPFFIPYFDSLAVWHFYKNSQSINRGRFHDIRDFYIVQENIPFLSVVGGGCAGCVCDME